MRHVVLLVLLLAGTMLSVRRWVEGQRLRPPAPHVPVGTQPDFGGTVARVDRAFSEDWARAGVRPAGRADELTVIRRLSLALTGTIPSVEEIRAYETPSISGNTREERIQWWLTHVFRDRRSADYLAERFARVLVGVEDGPFIVYRRRRLVTWLSDQMASNRPYDALVRELITAEGIWTSQPQVNFVTATVDQNNDEEGPDEQKLAGRVSRAFLGVRLDCVQCHDDFLGDRWKQRDFHQLAAFFACSEMSLTGVRDDPGRVYEHRYLRRPGKERVPAAVPFEGGLLPAAGPARERLAAWVTHPANGAFARALANRMWALLFNRPLHQPVDDIPPEGPWHPVLGILAEDLVHGGFDLRRLVRVIAATQAFQMDSRSGDPGNPVTPGHEAVWASFPLTRLRPEQVAGAILQSANLRTVDARSPVLVRLIRHFQQQDFIRRFGDPGQDEFDPVGGTLPQRLVLMNGEVVRERTGENPLLNACTRIAAVSSDAGTALETAYLAVLTRRPSPDESAHFLGATVGGTLGVERLGDIYWTLINSTEFSWNH